MATIYGFSAVTFMRLAPVAVVDVVEDLAALLEVEAQDEGLDVCVEVLADYEGGQVVVGVESMSALVAGARWTC